MSEEQDLVQSDTCSDALFEKVTEPAAPLPEWPFYRSGDGEEIIEERALAILLNAEQVFCNCRQYVEIDFGNQKPLEDRVNQSTVVLFLDCSDIFAWGCADAENFDTDDIEPIFRAWHANHAWGTAKWCCIKRNQQPQKPVADRMKAAGVWDAQMEALPSNKYDETQRKRANCDTGRGTSGEVAFSDESGSDPGA